MRRETVILAALLAVVLAAAIRFCPNRAERTDLTVKALLQAGRLPLPSWLERKRIEWLGSINPL